MRQLGHHDFTHWTSGDDGPMSPSESHETSAHQQMGVSIVMGYPWVPQNESFSCFFRGNPTLKMMMNRGSPMTMETTIWCFFTNGFTCSSNQFLTLFSQDTFGWEMRTLPSTSGRKKRDMCPSAWYRQNMSIIVLLKADLPHDMYISLYVRTFGNFVGPDFAGWEAWTCKAAALCSQRLVKRNFSEPKAR